MTKQSEGRARHLLFMGVDAAPVIFSKRDFAVFSKATGGAFKLNLALNDVLAAAKESAYLVWEIGIA